MAESSTTANTFRWASLALSTANLAGRTLCSWDNVAITATNSTWANLRPGHERGPSDHGTKVPFSGSIIVSDKIGPSRLLLVISHRSGRQVRGSGLHPRGSVWRAWTLV